MKSDVIAGGLVTFGWVSAAEGLTTAGGVHAGPLWDAGYAGDKAESLSLAPHAATNANAHRPEMRFSIGSSQVRDVATAGQRPRSFVSRTRERACLGTCERVVSDLRSRSARETCTRCRSVA